ncbi:6-phosphogluconolactonase [Lysobacter humi (ex Lee et al. 2017)]
MAWVVHDYRDASALTDALAVVLRLAAAEALALRGRLVMSLAGGRTPLAAYREFAALPRDWSRVILIPGDDRCVPHDHPASNVGQLRGIFAGARGVGIESLTAADGDPDASERQARGMLSQHVEPFDLTVLGMGADGHTASLFPGAAQLSDALHARSKLEACRIDPEPLPPEAPFPRISLTAARLLRARAIHLVVTGESKRAVLAEACAAPDPMRLPVSALLHAPGTLVHVHWSP